MLKIQNHKCKICPNLISIDTKEVDHDHKTGKVRGLLCHRCNLLLGLAKDDINILNNSIIYLS